jgi:plasmid stabilization system protein ParE
MFQIEWTGPARNDLRAIDRWLERETSPEFAFHILVTIRTRARFLENFPRGGRPYRDGLRIFRVSGTPYLLRYRIVAETGMVQILRVHHEREDWIVEP